MNYITHMKGGTQVTGRDLIIYILQNNLEDEEVFKDGKFAGFLTVEETAAKFKVGPATVKAWIIEGNLDAIQINDSLFIPCNGELRIGSSNS